MTTSDELFRLREENEDVALIFDTFTAIDRIYQESLRAMGFVSKERPLTQSSDSITLSTVHIDSTNKPLTVLSNR